MSPRPTHTGQAASAKASAPPPPPAPDPPEDERAGDQHGQRQQGRPFRRVERLDRERPEQQAEDQVELEEHAAAEDESGQRMPPAQAGSPPRPAP
jgi:hypothetical protein